jgi:alpha-beta hydrolase superfamily lysophospholipase
VTLPPLADIPAWLAAREARVPALREGCAARLDWGAAPGERTAVAVLYVHGFSASPAELSPYPERVAEGLGANAVFVRLSGHGQDGAAMGRARLADWRREVAEGFAIARAAGGRVLAIGCSTGALLLALALAEGEEAAGAVLVSPNFGLHDPRAARLLPVPLKRLWLPLMIGPERVAEMTPAQARIWTARFPTGALVPMFDALRALGRADLSRARVPALFAWADEDMVVSPAAAAAAMARWGGPAERLRLHPRPGCDPASHVLAGDGMCPAGTEPLVEATLDWAARALSPSRSRPAAAPPGAAAGS